MESKDGKIQVTMLEGEVDVCENLTESKLHVKKRVERGGPVVKETIVTLFHYSEWEDCYVIEEDEMQGYIIVLKELLRFYTNAQ